MKTVFVVAGFDLHETAANSEELKPLLQGLKSKGYNVVAFDKAWYRKTPARVIEEFKAFYNKYKTEENIVIGNSFGAVVAYVSAPELQPDEIYLCSLSPFFKEDRGKYPDEYAYKYFGKRRAHNLWQYSSDEVAKEINRTNTKVIAVYGEKEHETSARLVARTTDVSKKVKNSKLIEIPGAPHNMRDPVYTKAIVEMV
jgi:pimeloyl-ACP methyl ester carboxylesterase